MSLRSHSVALLSLCAGGLLACDGANAATDDSPTQAEIIARGEYLTEITGCHDCHTPWEPNADGVREPNRAKLLSGHQEDMETPAAPTDVPAAPWTTVVRTVTRTAFYHASYGTAFTTNLTPHPDSGGLEGWTEQTFIDMMRTGKEKGYGRKLATPMYNTCLRVGMMTDEDLKAMFAYLRSIPAIDNTVPDLIPPPPATP